MDDIFVLSALDREQWCPVLQLRFSVDDLADLHSILAEHSGDDATLQCQYLLDDGELAAINRRFGVAFPPADLPCRGHDVFLFRQNWLADAPYLIHTGYELPLLLDGRKKLAELSRDYPPYRFEGEDQFDRWVDRGVLSKSQIVEPLGVEEHLGHRTIYYTPKGEEWRVPAMRLLLKASGRSGGWNEHFERLQGMLFGYSDAENDWWIRKGFLERSGFGGASLCCAVTAEGLAWIEEAGFRALPPSPRPTVKMSGYWSPTAHELPDLFFRDPSIVAIVHFNVLGRHMMNLVDLREAGPWDFPSDQISQLNRHLRSPVSMLVHRDGSEAANEHGR